MIRRSILGLALLIAAVAPLQAQTPAAPAEAPLTAGDRVALVVWRNAELTGTYTVQPDGSLLHPLFLDVRLAEIPIDEARSRLETFLEGFVSEPQFTFQPLYRVYVGGNVRTQGEYHFPDSTVGQAIVNAGGSTTPDRRYRIRFIRDGQHTVVNLDGQEESALLQTRIQSGDQILVEERPTFSRTYLNPALQVIQTVTALVATYVYFDAIFSSE